MVLHKVGTAWEVAAPAKLNLYLDVLGRRTDGFHELETLMVPVQIFDQLRWEPYSPSGTPASHGCTLQVNTHFDCPELRENNLVLRAARLLAHHAGITEHGHFRLTKRIPLQAGLGGGSSDAAATLVLANRAWGAKLSHDQLVELAAQLGSDVPFFLHRGSAVCRCRGERVELLAGFPRLYFVLVKPPFGLSTPQVFAELGETVPPTSVRGEQSRRSLAELLEALACGATARACRYMINRLEAAAVRLAPELIRIKQALARSGCWGHFMTGSGSTVVGVARSAIQARRIARSLAAQNYGTVLATASGW